MPNWDHVLREIGKETNEPNNSAADKVRNKYLTALQKEFVACTRFG